MPQRLVTDPLEKNRVIFWRKRLLNSYDSIILIHYFPLTLV